MDSTTDSITTENATTEDTKSNSNIESHVICQFTFHPANGEITLEAADDIDVFDLVKCKRILDEQIDDAEAQFKISVLQSHKQMLVKLNATLEGLRELLKDVVVRKQEQNKPTSRRSLSELKYK